MKKGTHSFSKRAGIIIAVTGCLMILFSIGLYVRNDNIEKKAQVYSNEALAQLDPKLYERKTKIENASRNGKIFVPDYVLAPDMEMPVEEVNGQSYIGTIDIPALDLHLPIQSELDDRKMRVSPCRMEGTVYRKNIIIGAHSFKYHFGYLKNLDEGDLITFTDVSGNQFNYNVEYIEILSPFQFKELESGDWDMTLFTCTVGGRARVVVRLELI